MCQSADQAVARHLHALHRGHQNQHRADHHFIIKSLIAIANRQIAQPPPPMTPAMDEANQHHDSQRDASQQGWQRFRQ